MHVKCGWLKRKKGAISNEPQHDKTNKMICVSSEDSNQPGHPPINLKSDLSLCNALLSVANDPRLLHADSEDSDTTGQMPSLISLGAHFVSFCHDESIIQTHKESVNNFLDL